MGLKEYREKVGGAFAHESQIKQSHMQCNEATEKKITEKRSMALSNTGEAVGIRNQIHKQVSTETFLKLISIPSTSKGKQKPLNRADLQVLVINTTRPHKKVFENRPKKSNGTVHHGRGSQRKKSNT